jgi:lysophospholipase L1-like esterase
MKKIKLYAKRLFIFLVGVLISLGFWLLSSNGEVTLPTGAVAAQSFTRASTNSPKVVFFGSSTTVGVGATRGDRRWSTLLSRYLDWQEFNEGLSGSSLSKAPRTDKSWPIPAAVERWKDAVLRRHPDRVVMLYGANDAFWKLPLGETQSSATFRGDLKTLLSEMTAEFRPEQLVVVTPQPNQATLERRSPYDTALKKGAQKIGAHFIDATQASDFLEDLAAFSADGLHLNNLGHAAFASYLAGKLVDQGITPMPPLAQGGISLPNVQKPLSGGFLRVDLAHPLSFGEIRTISARWVAPGEARLIVMRPDGRDGYEAIYRTPLFSVKSGLTQTVVPRWWVLKGDRLAVWTNTNCLGSEPSNTPQHLAFSQNMSAAITDVKSTQAQAQESTLAVWIAPKTGDLNH